MSRWSISPGASLPADHSSSRNPVGSRSPLANDEVDRDERERQRKAFSRLVLDEEMRGVLLLCYACSLLISIQALGRYRGLEFLEPCSRHDPKLEACLAKTANILVEHFRQGERSLKPFQAISIFNTLTVSLT